jgi:hypothetical protein
LAPKRHGGRRVTIVRCLLLVAAMAVVTPGMPAARTLELVATVPLPGVKGRIDHLSADPRRHRIFVAALGNDTVEVVDTQNAQRRTIAGLGEPQGVLYLPDSDRLFIANGGSNRVDLVDVASFSVVRRIGGMDDADNVRYDASAGKVWVGFGRGALRILDPATGDTSGDIPLPGHPESFQLEQRGERAFVNVPTAGNVVVVDRTKRQVIDRWSTPDATANFRWRSTSKDIACSWECARPRRFSCTTPDQATSSRGCRSARIPMICSTMMRASVFT